MGEGVTEYRWGVTSLEVGNKDSMRLFKDVEDDFVLIPTWHYRLVVPDIELINPSDDDCAIEPSSPLTDPALQQPKG